MGVRKLDAENKWLVEVYVQGKRTRKKFSTKAEANRFYNSIKQENSPVYRALVVQKEQPQRLSELVQMWYDLHGRTLIRPQRVYSMLMWACEVMGDPLARDFSPSHFAEFRQKCLEGSVIHPNSKHKRPTKERTLNQYLIKFGGVFNELKRLGKWKGSNPLEDMRPFKLKQKDLYFLRNDEIERLLACCRESTSKSLYYVVKICLATGARWSEAEGLKGSQIIPYKITYMNTKSGKNRTVPISKELYDELPITDNGPLFSNCMKAFSNAVKKAGITLPPNQMTHVLRHTFASHFMMNGGNILVLRDILGHSDIKMTMIYAHFAPSYLEDAVTLNPLAKMAI
nr:tyrosine-type recombinase/integrase [uncultured Haemophilus sp.]